MGYFTLDFKALFCGQTIVFLSKVAIKDLFFKAFSNAEKSAHGLFALEKKIEVIDFIFHLAEVVFSIFVLHKRINFFCSERRRVYNFDR